MTSSDPTHQAERGYRQYRFRLPPGAAELLLIRHGESQPAYPDQPFPLTGGRADPELASEGVEQARLLALRLAGDQADAGQAGDQADAGQAGDQAGAGQAGHGQGTGARQADSRASSPGGASLGRGPLLGRGQQIDPGRIAAGERLDRGRQIDAIYISSLRRTAQTAAPLAELLGLTPRVEPELREVGLGEWEGGLYRKMVADNHPLAQRMWAEERWDVIPGAEPGEAFAARIRGVIERLAAAHPDQRLAVFTHGGVIGQALAIATGSRLFAFTGADNASISSLVVAGEWWIIRRFNDTAHLDPVFSTAVPAGSFSLGRVTT